MLKQRSLSKLEALAWMANGFDVTHILFIYSHIGRNC